MSGGLRAETGRLAVMAYLLLAGCGGTQAHTIALAELPDDATRGRFHAIVIGNQNYEDSRIVDLKTPHRDAREVARLLEQKFHYDVELVLDADRSTIYARLEAYRDLPDRDNLLVYYAGHGQQDPVTGTAYWLPVDARDKSRADWISANDISTMLEGSTAHHVLVVSDSCFSGALTRSVPMQMSRKLLATLSERAARVVMTSGSDQPVSDTGRDGHSVFAYHFIRLLDGMEEGQAIPASRLTSDLLIAVGNEANQTPLYGPMPRSKVHENGDFLFIRTCHDCAGGAGAKVSTTAQRKALARRRSPPAEPAERAPEPGPSRPIRPQADLAPAIPSAPARDAIGSSEPDTQTGIIDVRFEPEPGMRTVLILDGQSMEWRPPMRVRVPPGEHEVEVEWSGRTADGTDTNGRQRTTVVVGPGAVEVVDLTSGFDGFDEDW